MRILGIDPGYAIMGYGIVDKIGNKFSPCEYGSILTTPEFGAVDRLKILYNELMELIAEFQPEVAAVEELFFNTNQKTAIMVSQARGVALLACANSGLPVYEYTPLQIKTGIVGYGRAEKKQVQHMVKTMLCLNEIPKPDDTADALACALCHGNSMTYSDKIDRMLKKSK